MVDKKTGKSTSNALLVPKSRTSATSNISIMSSSYGNPAPLKMDKAWFIQSRVGNIKDFYFFEKKLGSGGYGAVYLAKNKTSGTTGLAN
jgi:hypothetical protein